MRQTSGSLRNYFRNAPFSIENSLSIEPDNKKRRRYKKRTIGSDTIIDFNIVSDLIYDYS